MDVLRMLTASLFVLRTGSHADDFELLKTEPEAFCPKGWYPFRDLCYKGFHENLNFEEAERKCVELGGHLAAITSREIQEHVTVQIILALEHRAYIGLRHNESLLRMHWTDGSELGFHDWDANEPSQKAPGGEIEHCVEMTFVDVLSRLGKWNDIKCDARIPYICQKAKGFEGEEPERGPGSCPWLADDFYYRKSCYHFSSHRKSWEEAEQYCVEHYSGHLASVTDVAVQKFLSYSMMKHGASDDRMWIGIRLQPDEVALWSSGWYMGYNNWLHRSAHKKVSFDSCGAMMKGSGQWDNMSCEESFAFICENSSAIPPPRLNGTTDGLICPPGETDWINLGGDYCYIIDIRTYVTWYRASFICMSKGGTLASIHSAAEERVLEQFAKYYPHPLHIGFFRNDRTQGNREFEWVDHSAVDYTNWRYGEPNSKDEMCAEVMPLQEMKWNDNKCENVAGFICTVSKVSSNKPQHGVKNKKQHNQEKCECLPVPAIIGVVMCVLLVIFLIGVVLYNVKPWRKTRRDVGKRKSSLVTEKPRYRTGERIISEQIYENVDSEF